MKNIIARSGDSNNVKIRQMRSKKMDKSGHNFLLRKVATVMFLNNV